MREENASACLDLYFCVTVSFLWALLRGLAQPLPHLKVGTAWVVRLFRANILYFSSALGKV